MKALIQYFEREKAVDPEPIPPVGLEALLEEMSAYGWPRVSRHDTGWHASVEMRVTVVGAEFTVRSAFNHPTPLAAAQECLTRVRAVAPR